MTNKYATYFIGSLLSLLMLTGCSADSDVTPVEKGSVYINMGFADADGLTLNWEAEHRASSRATELPEIPAPMAVKPADIGVWGFNNQTATPVFSNRRMVYIYGPEYPELSNILGQWPVANEYPYENPEQWVPSTDTEPSRYKFFAYSPYTPTEGLDTDDVIAYTEEFDNFTAFIWHRLPRYTKTDYLINRNMLNYTSVTGERHNPVQHLLMEHLYSRLRFCFILGPRFGDLREIHIKSVTLNDLPADRLMMAAIFGLITNGDDTPLLDANGNYTYTCHRYWDNEPESGLEPVSISLDMDEELADLPLYTDPDYPVFDSDGYLLLTARNREHYGYLPMGSLFAYPGEALPKISFSVIYDIYDKDGLLLRENETASNTIDLDFLPSGSPSGRVLEPGHYYDVKIEIEPRFLFVLSDNDVFPDGKITIP